MHWDLWLKVACDAKNCIVNCTDASFLLILVFWKQACGVCAGKEAGGCDDGHVTFDFDSIKKGNPVLL